MPELPTLNDLEEEHWAIVVLAHRLAEAVQGHIAADDLADLVDELYWRCDGHLRREESLFRRFGLAGQEGVTACRDYLHHLLMVMKSAHAERSNDLPELMAAFEAALVMLLQHDRAMLTALHATRTQMVQSAAQ